MLNDYHLKRVEYLEKMRPTYPEIVPKGTLFETFDLKDAVVWIDPLDGTNDFVTGNLPAVTVLIGLSIKGVSRIGIVHNPFNEDDNTLGRTLFGTIEHGLFKIDYNEKNCSGETYQNRNVEYIEPFDHLEVPSNDHKFIVAASISHFSPQMKEIIETIHPVEIKRIGGAGNKCASLALGKVDSYIHPSPGLKYWDLCASEILIKAMGGYATNAKQERLTYNPENDRKLAGLIVSRNP